MSATRMLEFPGGRVDASAFFAGDRDRTPTTLSSVTQQLPVLDLDDEEPGRLLDGEEGRALAHSLILWRARFSQLYLSRYPPHEQNSRLWETIRRHHRIAKGLAP